MTIVSILTGQSKFVLTATSGSNSCPTTEVAVIWPYINIEQTADCNYTYSGLKDSAYVFPVTFAPVKYPTHNGGSQPYTLLQSTANYNPGTGKPVTH